MEEKEIDYNGGHYSVYDFEESLTRELKKADVKRVIAAWGIQGDYSEWSGGFILELNDGRFAHLQGWCDTTGWGCQDGARVDYFSELPEFGTLTQAFSYSENLPLPPVDHDPKDLNHWLESDRESDAV